MELVLEPKVEPVSDLAEVNVSELWLRDVRARLYHLLENTEAEQLDKAMSQRLTQLTCVIDSALINEDEDD